MQLSAYKVQRITSNFQTKVKTDLLWECKLRALTQKYIPLTFVISNLKHEMNLLKWWSFSSFDYCICIECLEVYKCRGVCLFSFSICLWYSKYSSSILWSFSSTLHRQKFPFVLLQFINGYRTNNLKIRRNISAMCFSWWKHIELYLRLTFAASCYLQLPTISKLCIFGTFFCMIDFLYIVEARTTLQILYLSFFLRKCKVYIQLTSCCDNLFQ